MRDLQTIDKELAEVRNELSSVEGSPTEVYSRIVGYYRSVRNWNKGKREEYGERRLYVVQDKEIPELKQTEPAKTDTKNKKPTSPAARIKAEASVSQAVQEFRDAAKSRIMLFVGRNCPACPPAKDAVMKLGFPMDLIYADTEAGLAEAAKRDVYSTPTAILLGSDGNELGRALDARSISTFATLYPET